MTNVIRALAGASEPPTVQFAPGGEPGRNDPKRARLHATALFFSTPAVGAGDG
jgi:hypothetical protein